MTFPAIACKPRFIDDSSMRDDLHAYACTWNARQRLGLLSMDREFLYRSLGILYSGQPREISTAQPCNMGNILFDSTQPTQLYIGWNCAIFILITVEVFSDKLIGESKSNILTSSIWTRTSVPRRAKVDKTILPPRGQNPFNFERGFDFFISLH